jgi:flagellar L-ring protein precursor FlgH
MSTRTSSSPLEGLLGLGTIAGLVLAFAPSPAHAQILGIGKKKPKEDYSVSLPAPVAPVAPAANGSIFQVSDGYAALYEGQRARKIGDPLTIVLVERTTASKSASSKLDSGGGFSITPPTTGNLSLFMKSDASVSGGRNFNGTGATDQSNAADRRDQRDDRRHLSQRDDAGARRKAAHAQSRRRTGSDFGHHPCRSTSAPTTASCRPASPTRTSVYVGKGEIARASKQGWLQRFFSIISPF